MLKNSKIFIRKLLAGHLIYPAALGFFLFTVLVLARTDMWDGTIINYASATNQFQGIRRLTADTDLDSVILLFHAEIFAAKFFHLDFFLVDRFVLALSFVLISSCVYQISRIRFQLSERWSAFALLLFLTFPVWHILTSSTQTFYFILLALGMWGVEFVYRGKKTYTFFGIITILMSFEMNSMILFAPALALLYESTEAKAKTLTMRLIRPFGIAILGIAYWTISRSLSQPSGLYAGYNKIVNPLSLNGWSILKAGFTNYATFALLPLLGLAILACIVILFYEKISYAPAPTPGNLSPLISLIPLCFASIFPYTIVQKSTFVDDFDWDGRHAIPLSIPFSLLVMLATRLLFRQIGVRGFQKILWKLIAVAILVVPQSFVLMHGLALKLGRQEFEEKLINELKTKQVKPGVVEIIGLPSFVPDFRVYESNFLMFRTFKGAKWWTRIGQVEDPSFAVPVWITRIDYQEIYIYQPPTTTCRTVIQINYVRPSGFWEDVKSTVRISNDPSIKIESIQSVC